MSVEEQVNSQQFSMRACVGVRMCVCVEMQFERGIITVCRRLQKYVEVVVGCCGNPHPATHQTQPAPTRNSQ